MVRFGVPNPPARSVIRVQRFEGVDFTNPAGSVDASKSPDACNMIRDVPGKVRKCMGYERMAEFHDENGEALAINGWHCRSGESTGLIHAGTRFYREDVLLRSDGADERSRSWEMSRTEENGNCRVLVIQDGKRLLLWDGESLTPAEESAYIPTLTIAKSPEGGGTDYEALNLLQPAFIELFAGTAGVKDYQLTLGGLDSTPVKVWVMGSNGGWQEKTEGTDFTVNREDGTVSFVSAPGLSPVTGEDNVKIQASRTVEGYAERINRCRCGILFGVGGAADRLFVSGNPDPELKNLDWFSGQDDPTYWPDTGYCAVGGNASAVVGYAIVDGLLAAFKDENEPDRNVILREGRLTEGEAGFPMVKTLQGAGACARFGFGYLAAEPLFLTRLGVYALTTSDVSGDRYSQGRSYYLDGKLREEEGLEEAFGFVYHDLYWLCLNGAAYILDGLQPMRTDSGAPYSTRQYAGFYRTNLPARVMWEQEGRLWFGSKEGRVYRFYDDPDAPASYCDDETPVDAWWTTGMLYGGAFERNKDFRKISLLMDSAPVTGAEVWRLCRGRWELLRTESAGSRYRSWGAAVWSKWCWRCDDTPRVLVTRVGLRKSDKAQFRFRNREQEPFGLLQYACEYTAGSYCKG